MNATRRNVLKLAGGGAVGALFTPAPWRLITDAALWSENWPGIPRPARGEITSKATNCSLCTAGCPVRARCVAGQPVAMIGAQCPFGITGHHLPYHPARVRQGPVQQAAEAVARGRRVAVLDLRPGRTASWTYRRAMKAMKGTYIAPPQPPAAVDLAAAKIVLSAGVPVLEDWGTPRNVLAARGHFRLIYAGAVETRTAALADEWIRVQPGSEQALVEGIAGSISAGEAAARTGIPAERIASLAAELRDGGPSLVLDAEFSPEALSLSTGTLAVRAEAPVPATWAREAAPVTALADVANGSIDVLLIDESAPGEYLPWNTIQPKLVRNDAAVIAFAWSRRGYGRWANYVLPAPVYPEALDDIPPAIDSPAPVFRLSVPLMTPPEGTINPAKFAGDLAGINAAAALRGRAKAIDASDEFWKSLNEGATWIGKPKAWQAGSLSQKSMGSQSPAAETDLPLTVVLTERRGGAAPVSPVLSKLYQESELRLGPNRAALNPDDARAAGLAEGERASLQTAIGRCDIAVAFDASLPRGVVEAAARPGILDVCAPGARAKVVRL